MTLILATITPQGLALCSDHAVTSRDGEAGEKTARAAPAQKHVLFRGTDATALIATAGLGELSYVYKKAWASKPAGVSIADLPEEERKKFVLDQINHGKTWRSDTSEWICQEISGEHEPTFERCAERLKTAASATSAFAEAGTATVFAMVGFKAGKPFVALISNIGPEGVTKPLPSFATHRVGPVGGGASFILGVDEAVSPDDRAAIELSSQKHKESPREHLAFLAGANVLAAETADAQFGGGISASCTVTYLPNPSDPAEPLMQHIVWPDERLPTALTGKVPTSLDGLNVSRVWPTAAP
jgi:hypothetical protein